MLSVSILFEDIVRRRDIAGGIGGNFGRYEGMLMGAGAGALLGAKASGLSPEEADAIDYDTNANAPAGPLVGMYLGAGLGAALGGQAGRAIGRNIISNPDAPADFSKTSHRIGHLANPNTKWYGALSDIILPGSAPYVGAIRNAVSDEGAKRLGYGGAGRVAQILTVPTGFGDVAPLFGVVPPDKIAKNKKK